MEGTTSLGQDLREACLVTRVFNPCRRYSNLKNSALGATSRFAVARTGWKPVSQRTLSSDVTPTLLRSAFRSLAVPQRPCAAAWGPARDPYATANPRVGPACLHPRRAARWQYPDSVLPAP